jgi:hypothetical protein
VKEIQVLIKTLKEKVALSPEVPDFVNQEKA